VDDVPHSRNITENHLGGYYSDDRTVNLEEFLDCLTLTETETQNVKCEPEVGNGIIPGIALSGDKKRL
jgi:hypothetical protein